MDLRGSSLARSTIQLSVFVTFKQALCRDRPPARSLPVTSVKQIMDLRGSSLARSTIQLSVFVQRLTFKQRNCRDGLPALSVLETSVKTKYGS